VESSDINNHFGDTEKPGFFEKIGIALFFQLARKNRTAKLNFENLTDEEMLRKTRKITVSSGIIAFAIGGISAWGSVATELLFPETACEVFISFSCMEKYGWVMGVTLFLTVIEFAVLIWVSIYAVYHISIITGHNRSINEDNITNQIPNLLSRAALEIPDPVRHVLGIDPYRNVSKKKLLFFGMLYKLKVVLSNVLAKLILRRVFGKSILRVGAEFISVPITGLWNALVIFKVSREARLRLFGNLLARHIAENEITDEKLKELSETARLCCLQALGNSIVLTQNYHPNMVILILRLIEVFNHKNNQRLDSWDEFVQNCLQLTAKERNFVMDLLSIAAAFDGKISRLEKEKLGEVFMEYTEIYFQRIKRLKHLMLSGRLNEAIGECALDFEPG